MSLGRDPRTKILGIMLKIRPCWKLTSKINSEGHSGKQIHSSLSINVTPMLLFPVLNPYDVYGCSLCQGDDNIRILYNCMLGEGSVCVCSHACLCVY